MTYAPLGGVDDIADSKSHDLAAGPVAVLANGDTVVTWVDYTKDIIHAQMLDVSGAEIGGPFQIGADGNLTLGPTLTALPGGGFSAVWTEFTGNQSDLAGQVFDAAGHPTGAQFQVNTVTAGNQLEASSAALTGGGFVVAWTDGSGQGGDASPNGIKEQLFNADGTKVGGEVLVNTQTAGDQAEPHVAALSGGGSVVSWDNVNGSDNDVAAQVFDASGHPVGGELTIATGAGNQVPIGAAGLAGGGFVLVWNDDSGSTSTDVIGQVFDASGAPIGAAFTVNTATAGAQSGMSVVGLPDGGFVVTWLDQNAGSTMLGQVFDASGHEVGDELTISGPGQSAGSAAVYSDGRIIDVWSDGHGVNAQILGPAIEGDDGNNTLQGTSGPDAILGYGGNDSLQGAGGDDSLNGGTGNDTVSGGDGNDVLVGGGGNDSLSGDAGNDSLQADAGNNTLSGGDGFDTLSGGAGSHLDGGANTDILIVDRSAATTALTVSASGGSGTVSDGTTFTNGEVMRVTTGAGDDTVSIASPTAGSTYTVDAGAGSNSAVVDMTAATTAVTFTGGAAGSSQTVADGGATKIGLTHVQAVTVLGGAGDDTLAAGSAEGQATLAGGIGNDSISSSSTGAGGDSLSGGAGNDVITHSGPAPVQIGAGAGVDTVNLDDSSHTTAMTANIADTMVKVSDGSTIKNAEAVNLTTGSGSDAVTVAATTGHYTVNEGSGSNSVTIDMSSSTQAVFDNAITNGYVADNTDASLTVIVNNVSAGTIIGGSGNDGLTGGTHNDTLSGNGGDDTLTGGSGDGSLAGGAGNDVLDPGAGKDIMTGGTGADTFMFGYGDGKDKVKDLTIDDGDHVHLAAGTSYTLSDHGSSAHVTLGDGSQLVLSGVSSGTASLWLEVG